MIDVHIDNFKEKAKECGYSVVIIGYKIEGGEYFIVTGGVESPVMPIIGLLELAKQDILQDELLNLKIGGYDE